MYRPASSTAVSWASTSSGTATGRPALVVPSTPDETPGSRAPESVRGRRSAQPTCTAAPGIAGTRSPGMPPDRNGRARTWPMNSTIGVESCAALCRPIAAWQAPGPRVTHDDSGPSGELAVGFRHVRGAAFVPAGDRRDLAARVVQGVRGRPGSSLQAHRRRYRRRGFAVRRSGLCHRCVDCSGVMFVAGRAMACERFTGVRILAQYSRIESAVSSCRGRLEPRSDARPEIGCPGLANCRRRRQPPVAQA